jgi:hypothetical protein
VSSAQTGEPVSRPKVSWDVGTSSKPSEDRARPTSGETPTADPEDTEFEEELDADIARFDANAAKFDEWQALLDTELSVGETDDEEAQHWLTLAEEALRETSPDARVRVRCAASICEIALESPEPTANLLAHSAGWLRVLDERAIGETSPPDDHVETDSALDTQRQKAEGSASVVEGFSILVPNRNAAPP